MERKELELFLGEDWTRVRDYMSSVLVSDVDLLARTNSSIMEHSGKQLRPMLALVVARACGGGCNEDTIRFAAATELLHNATLLHDDVVDSSPERRGTPTINSILGPRASILVGDFWLVKVMETVMACDTSVSETGAIFAGTLCNLAEGEMLQLQKSVSCDTTMEDYLKIIYSKTASLFETACHTAALSIGACPSELSAAREYGRCLGMAFQIKDDILDYSGNNLGKPVDVDLKEKKITLPLLGALARVPDTEAFHIRRLVSEIGPDADESIEEIRRFVDRNGGVTYAEGVLKEYSGKALQALDGLRDCEEKKILARMVDYLAERES